jgi:uncharacterized protein YeeX (DUF496 family)
MIPMGLNFISWDILLTAIFYYNGYAQKIGIARNVQRHSKEYRREQNYCQLMKNIAIYYHNKMQIKDISRAFLYHLQWKTRLRDFVDGKCDFDPAEISPEGCNLGKWLSSEEVKQYVSSADIQELISAHDELNGSKQCSTTRIEQYR